MNMEIESIEDEGLREAYKEFKERSEYLKSLIMDFKYLSPGDIVILYVYALNGHKATMSLKYNGKELEEDIKL